MFVKPKRSSDRVNYHRIVNRKKSVLHSATFISRSMYMALLQNPLQCYFSHLKNYRTEKIRSNFSDIY